MDWLRKASRFGNAPKADPHKPHPLGQPLVRVRGPQHSNFPHIFRDGGGGGMVGGLPLIIFADGMYTKGLPPTEDGRIVKFVSNSIAVVGPSIDRVTDTGSVARGPDEAIPFLTDQGESAMDTGVWPNQNIASIDTGAAGVTFPEVVDRRLFRAQKQAFIYNTAIVIHLQAGRPVVTRPHKSLFLYGEPLFGSFCTCTTTPPDGFLYLFARVSETAHAKYNGLRLARVRPEAWADRQQYTFWDGTAFVAQMPAVADGHANVFSYSLEAFGKHYGPGTGDIFWSPVYGRYLLLFQNAAAALDDNLYFAHSTSLTSGWCTASSIWKIPRASDGYSYAFHAHPHLDPSGKVVPITWTRDSKAQSCTMQTGEVVFS